MSLPLRCRTRLFHGSGGITGYTTARGKPASAIQLMNLPHLSSGLCFLQLPTLAACFCSCPTPAGYWHSGMCAQVVGSACLSARQIPGPYSCPSHADSNANKEGRARAEW